MTWRTSYSTQSTINIGPFKGTDGPSTAIFHLKELMKSVGWTVLSSSDGTTYNSSGDQITHTGSGAGGIANSNAWFRIEDPGSLREYVFQRSTTDYTWIWRYSASDGFTGGTPNATTIPTATDQQGLAKASDTAQALWASALTFYCSIAVQDTAHNGVYSWWLISPVVQSTSSSGPGETFMACEAMDSSYSTNDNDPCIHYGSDDRPLYTAIANSSIASQTDSFRGWMRYGEVDEQWSGISGVYYYTYSSIPTWPILGMVNPHNGKYPLLPIPYYRHASTASLVGFKGVGKYFRWRPTQYITYPSVLSDVSDNYAIYGDICLPGIPSGVSLRS